MTNALRQPLSDTALIVGTASVVLGVLGSSDRRWLACVLIALLFAVLRPILGVDHQRGARTFLLVVISVVASTGCGFLLGSRAWHQFHESFDRIGPTESVQGPATLKTDPQRFGAGVVAVIEINGVRCEARAYGRLGRRLDNYEAGDAIVIGGEAALPPTDRLGRFASRHVVATLAVTYVGDTLRSSPAARSANRVRRLLREGTAGFPALDQALFMGLVIGDDREEPDELIDDFRASGLSHLTAVSGQNVAFVLLAASPLLRRFRPVPRWAVSIVLIAWFALVTRFEPSVLRASGMAVLASTAYWRGWNFTALRSLSLTTTAFVLIDPLLVWSVGWWLSVGATAGIAVLGGPIAARLPGPAWVRVPIATSVSAQIGTLPATLLVFGRAPLIGLVANALAVPVAGVVMVWGIPAGLLAGALPWTAQVVHVPSRLGTRWVLVVARLAARLEPDGLGRWPGLIYVVAVVALLTVPQRRAADRVGPNGRLSTHR